MTDYVYCFDSKDVQALKKTLEADSMDEKSFARLGYQLKEGKTAGLKEGKYYVCFKTSDDSLAKFLEEKLKLIPSFAVADEADAKALLDKISEEENSAAQGFGSLFE